MIVAGTQLRVSHAKPQVRWESEVFFPGAGAGGPAMDPSQLCRSSASPAPSPALHLGLSPACSPAERSRSGELAGFQKEI